MSADREQDPPDELLTCLQNINIAMTSEQRQVDTVLHASPSAVCTSRASDTVRGPIVSDTTRPPLSIASAEPEHCVKWKSVAINVEMKIH